MKRPFTECDAIKDFHVEFANHCVFPFNRNKILTTQDCIASN